MVTKGNLSVASILTLEIGSFLMVGLEVITSTHQEETRACLLTVPTIASIPIIVRGSFRKEFLAEGLTTLHQAESRVCTQFPHNMASAHPILEIVMQSGFLTERGLEDRNLLHQEVRGTRGSGSVTSRFPPNNLHQDGSLTARSLPSTRDDPLLILKDSIQGLVTSVTFIERGTSSTQIG